MKKQFAIFLFAIITISVASASTKLLSMWVDPAHKGKMKNVVVIGVTKPGMRTIWENIFVYELEKRGIKATPSYELFPDSDQNIPEDVVIQKVAAGGFDGIILTTSQGIETGKKYVASYITGAPVYYASWYGGYATGVQFWRQPGYEKDIVNVRMETTVWDTAPPGKMIWSGTTEAVNVTSAVKVSKDVTSSIIKELSSKKIL
jgi:hypothetical protein